MSLGLDERVNHIKSGIRHVQSEILRIKKLSSKKPKLWRIA